MSQLYYNPLTKEEEFHELVKEIESQSAYKRQPPLEKKYMSVPEMGRLLGLKKTDPNNGQKNNGEKEQYRKTYLRHKEKHSP